MTIRQFIGSARMGLAVAVSLYISILFRLENPYWAATTIIVVEGIDFYSFADKIFPRFLGNVCGTISGILFLACFSQTDWFYAVIFSLAIMVGAYFMFNGKCPQFWRWTLVSACIICISNVNTPLHAFYLGADRIAGVFIGLFVNLIFHLFFFQIATEKDEQNENTQSDKEETSEVNTDNINTSTYSNILLNIQKAFLVGLSVFLGMILWRETGWPGGATVPLLAMIQVIFCFLNPVLTIPLLITVQVIGLVIASLVTFFILPHIYSTEFFFITILLLYFIFGLFIHSPKIPLRGIGLMVGVLVNSCVYAYKANSYAFSVSVIYAWCMTGGILIMTIILYLFDFIKSSKVEIKNLTTSCKN